MFKVMTKMAIAMMLALPMAVHAEDAAQGLSKTAKPPLIKGRKWKKAAKAAAPKATAVKQEHWVCPMHDGGESDHAGKCPKCGMDLVLEVAPK